MNVAGHNTPARNTLAAALYRGTALHMREIYARCAALPGPPMRGPKALQVHVVQTLGVRRLAAREDAA